MCLILDANKKDMRPVRKWIKEKGGKIAYSTSKKFKKEMNEYIEQFAPYRVANILKKHNKYEVQALQNNLSGLKSNDPHIIALALVGNIRLLVSGDRKLHKDFKERIRNGKIYQNKNHSHLLTKTSCP